ncbi:MAG: hypothetical protein EXR66_04120 [Dehalococcoidia bacterium]|nr:hypothetical protein [Dehalococcoidia bacterium]
MQVFAHSGALLAVPQGRSLGIGVSGPVIGSRPLGPLWQLEIALGGRAPILARWEWDAEPPETGTIVDLATSAAGLLFFSKPSVATGADGAMLVTRPDAPTAVRAEV